VVFAGATRRCLPVALLLGSACASVGLVREEPLDDGLLAYYSRSSDVTLAAACQAIHLEERATFEGADSLDSAATILSMRGREAVRVAVTSTASETSAVRVLSLPTGQRNRAGLGGGIGAVTGLVAGAVFGYAEGEDSCASTGPFSGLPCFTHAGSAVLGGIVFAAFGAVVGRLVGRGIKSDRWMEIPWPPGTDQRAVAHPDSLPTLPPCPATPKRLPQPQSP
jgi:hypothetical protein